MRFPTVHLNGTPRQRLLEDICEAGNKLREAIDALAVAGPNARDYYVQGGDAFEEARREHMARQQKLQNVYDDLQTIALAIAGVTR